jgi:hypothetical protein
MIEGFKYSMPRWLPFQDQEACARVRAITREEITNTPSQHLKVRVLRDDEFPFRMIMDQFGRIKQAAEAGERLVLILPQPEPLYSWLALLCNKFRVSCHNLYTFNMDEYADADGNIAPESWSHSFLFNMKKNFYAKLDPALRPPEDHFQGPSNENFKNYGKMIADMGGADVIYGGIGWSGHVAYIEPGSEAFAPCPMEEWVKIGPRIVELTPFSILQNSLGAEFGASGDWSIVPPKGATIGPAEYMGAKLRSSWNAFRIGTSPVSWQRFTVRLGAHAPITPLLPCTMLQMAPSEMYLSETLAATIQHASVERLSWYEL